jgi:hypothetical protein
MNASRDYISHEMDISNELDAAFNFPKIYLMSHWAKQIRWSGALQLYSAERHEQANKANLKDGWNTSNHNLKYLPKVITFQRHILWFKIRDLNFKALAQRYANSAPASKVFHSGADLAAPLSSQSHAELEFIGPQHRHDGEHPDTMIKLFRTLLDNTQEAMPPAATYSGSHVFIQHKSRKKRYIADEQLHAMELCIYHGIQVQVESFKGECISQICRCAGSQNWRGGDWLNDWVCVKQHPGRCYGMLNGRLPWQLPQLLKIKLQNQDGAFVEYWLALALTTLPENLWNLDPVSKFVQVRQTTPAITFQVFIMGNIVGCVHKIPEIANCGKPGAWQNERWIVICHIHLVTWNDVYNQYRENFILRPGRTDMRRDFCNVSHRIAILMQARTQWTHSDVWSQLAITPECSFELGDWQSENKRCNSTQRVIYNAMRVIGSSCGVMPMGCLWLLWRSASTVREPFHLDGNIFFWCWTSTWTQTTLQSHWLMVICPFSSYLYDSCSHLY